jgi:acetyltransferase-like isoleucine patch superfamily enzyme
MSPKIEVGDNSVVAAGSVVIDNVPPNVMVAGVPSKIKKTI